MRLKDDFYLSDDTAREDLLNFRPYIDAISSIVLGEELSTPFTIGIYGRWGSGKSSLMNLVRARIDKKKDPNINCVWFTPWQYQGQPNLVAPFLITVLDHARKSQKFKTAFEEIKKLSHVTADYLLEAIAKPLIDTKRIKKIGESYEEQESIAADSQFKKLLFQHRLRGEFGEIVKSLTGKSGRLVIFIDDLDRCSSSDVIGMLESIKLFLGVENCVFIVGLNHEVISSCVKEKYQAFGRTRQSLSDVEVEEYLEKIIQLPFRIPPLDFSSVEKFIEKVEKNKDISALKPLFAKHLNKNPRKVKKVLNIYRLTLRLAKARGLVKSGRIHPELLAKTIIIRERYPAHYLRFEDSNDLLVRLTENAKIDILSSPLTSIPLKDRNELNAILTWGKHRFTKKDAKVYFDLSDTTQIQELSIATSPEPKLQGQDTIIPAGQGTAQINTPATALNDKKTANQA